MVREFVFVRPLEALVVMDRMEDVVGLDREDLRGPLRGQLRRRWDPGTTLIQNGDQALQVMTLVPSTVTSRVVNEGGNAGQFRLEIDGVRLRPGTPSSCTSCTGAT